MAWSTRQLAELAGTTVKAVRHYHRIGLLEEPERAANGYKRYGAEDLVRLLRIRKLADIGLSLAQIAETVDTGEPPEEALRRLDVELAAAVDRLREVRSELSLILSQRLPVDLPVEIASVAGTLTETDRSLALVMTRVTSPETAGAYVELLRDSEPHPSDEAFASLSADADEQRRRDVAELMLPLARRQLADYPELDWASFPTASPRIVEAVVAMMPALFNPAQLDVLVRVGRELLTDRERDGQT